MALKRLSKTFYKVSTILSIVIIALTVVGIITIGVSFGLALADGTAIKDPAGNVYDKATLVAILVTYEILLVFSLAHTIVNLVVSKKAYANPTKTLHILGIIFGLASGVEFSAAAGILGLIALAKEGRSQVVDVEAKDK